ncbi:MAG: hypothetical protein KDC26_05505 [Armatimonadetes bacterium]|nr:hypothetical protein [Armatimonadota bacterium]
MKIYSPYKDYYDSVLAYGQDDHIVYHRKQEVIAKEESQMPSEVVELVKKIFSDSIGSQYRRQRPVILFVGVAGKLYARWYLYDEGTSMSSELLSHQSGRFFTLESFQEYDRQKTIEEQWHHRYTMDVVLDRRDKILVRALEELSVFRNDQLFIECNCPILIIRIGPLVELRSVQSKRRYEIIKNPRLANLKMESDLDPFTMMQELEMYLGNQLSTRDESALTTGSDEDIARAKGFDEQSFRTSAPGNKKLNRKKNRERKKGSD